MVLSWAGKNGKEYYKTFLIDENHYLVEILKGEEETRSFWWKHENMSRELDIQYEKLSSWKIKYRHTLCGKTYRDTSDIVCGKNTLSLFLLDLWLILVVEDRTDIS